MPIFKRTYQDGTGRTVKLTVQIFEDPKKVERALISLANRARDRGGKTTAAYGWIRAEAQEVSNLPPPVLIEGSPSCICQDNHDDEYPLCPVHDLHCHEVCGVTSDSMQFKWPTDVNVVCRNGFLWCSEACANAQRPLNPKSKS